MNPTLALLSVTPMELIASIAIVSGASSLLLVCLYLWLESLPNGRPEKHEPIPPPPTYAKDGAAHLIKRCAELLDREPDATDEPLYIQLARILKDRASAKEKLLEATSFDSQGITTIVAERRRQFSAKGFSLQHDRLHVEGELARAAACYATPARSRPIDHINGNRMSNAGDLVPNDWPFEDERWKPNPDDRIRELAKAGALCAAEIDRIDAAKKGESA